MQGMPAVKCKESQPGTVSDVQQALLWLLADGINPEFIDVQVSGCTAHPMHWRHCQVPSNVCNCLTVGVYVVYTPV